MVTCVKSKGGSEGTIRIQKFQETRGKHFLFFSSTKRLSYALEITATHFKPKIPISIFKLSYVNKTKRQTKILKHPENQIKKHVGLIYTVHQITGDRPISRIKHRIKA